VDEILPGLSSGKILVDMSSGAPAATQKIARDLGVIGVAVVDAPVSGGVSRAVTGELAIMTGGDAAALDRVDPLLRAMGTTIHRIGPVGAGQAMKALNNLVSAGGFLMAVEALVIGQQFGLDPSVMTDVLNASTGMNNSTQKKLKQFVLSRKFDSGFSLDLMVKDLSIALEVGRNGSAPTPFSALCREMWASAASMLGKGQDHTAIAKLSEALAGVTLGNSK
jgi:3-hydroxyisobutyrate dehydrogenase